MWRRAVVNTITGIKYYINTYVFPIGGLLEISIALGLWFAV